MIQRQIHEYRERQREGERERERERERESDVHPVAVSAAVS